MSIKTTLSSDGSAINITFSGVFDINESIKIQDIINTLEKPVKIIRIDLQEVTSVDSSVFSSLLLIYYEMNYHAKIELINCDRALARQFSLAGLDRLVTIRLSSASGSKASSDIDSSDQTKKHQ